jgi:hypothetical protein
MYFEIVGIAETLDLIAEPDDGQITRPLPSRPVKAHREPGVCPGPGLASGCGLVPRGGDEVSGGTLVPPGSGFLAQRESPRTLRPRAA